MCYPNLSVHFRGHGDDLHTLSHAMVTIWNSGRETLHGTEMADADPLQIHPADGVVIALVR